MRYRLEGSRRLVPRHVGWPHPWTLYMPTRVEPPAVHVMLLHFAQNLWVGVERETSKRCHVVKSSLARTEYM